MRNTYKPVHGFFHDILHAEYRAATDVYALMFLTDVVDFIIIVFGFWAFGVGIPTHAISALISSLIYYPLKLVQKGEIKSGEGNFAYLKRK